MQNKNQHVKQKTLDLIDRIIAVIEEDDKNSRTSNLAHHTLYKLYIDQQKNPPFADLAKLGYTQQEVTRQDLREPIFSELLLQAEVCCYKNLIKLEQIQNGLREIFEEGHEKGVINFKRTDVNLHNLNNIWYDQVQETAESLQVHFEMAQFLKQIDRENKFVSAIDNELCDLFKNEVLAESQTSPFHDITDIKALTKEERRVFAKQYEDAFIKNLLSSNKKIGRVKNTMLEFRAVIDQTNYLYQGKNHRQCYADLSEWLEDIDTKSEAFRISPAEYKQLNTIINRQNKKLDMATNAQILVDDSPSHDKHTFITPADNNRRQYPYHQSLGACYSGQYPR